MEVTKAPLWAFISTYVCKGKSIYCIVTWMTTAQLVIPALLIIFNRLDKWIFNIYWYFISLKWKYWTKSTPTIGLTCWNKHKIYHWCCSLFMYKYRSTYVYIVELISTANLLVRIITIRVTFEGVKICFV